MDAGPRFLFPVSLVVPATTQGGATVNRPSGVVSLSTTGTALRANGDGTVTGLAAATVTVQSRPWGVSCAFLRGRRIQP